MSNEYDDVDFDALRARTDDWMKKAIQLLSKTHEFYRLAVKQLETRRGAHTAFPDFEFDKKDRDALSQQFQDSLATPSVSLGKMARKITKLKPSRFFLFLVMKAKINQLLNAQKTVPEPYLELEQEYSDIIKELCISGLLLVPKLCSEPKGNLSPSERQGEGYLGLVKAEHKYDFNRVKNDKPVKFSTCARYWINEPVYNRIYRDTFYVKVEEKAKKAYFQNQKGLEADNNLASDARNAAHPVPLDGNIGEDGTSILDTIDNSYAIGSPVDDPEQEHGAWEWSTAAQIVLSQHLPELEFNVFVAKFKALNHDGDMTDLEIARALSITSAQVPEILASAIAKIQKCPDCLALFEQLKK